MKIDPKDMVSISENYDIRIENNAPIEAGEENSSFLVHTAENEYVLTVYENKSLQRVKYVCLILNHLAEHYYYSNRLVSTADGKFVFMVEDKPADVRQQYRPMTHCTAGGIVEINGAESSDLTT